MSDPLNLEGDGMAPNEQVNITIEDAEGAVIANSEVTADEAGAFVASYELPEGAKGAQYTMRAKGATSGTEMSNSFDMGPEKTIEELPGGGTRES